MDALIQLQLSPILGPPKATGKPSEVRFNCPKCEKKFGEPDTKFHLYVNPVKGKFVCYRCGFRGSVDKLLQAIGATGEEAWVPDWEETVERLLNAAQGAQEAAKTPEAIELPEDYFPALPGSAAHAYCVGRGMSSDEVAIRWVGYGAGKRKGMVIFPEYDEDGRLLYWSAKSYCSWRKAPLNGGNRGGYIYWLAPAREAGDVCFVCEGVFDAAVFRDHGVALLGHSCSQEQLQSLLDAKFSRYYLALDGDVWDEQLPIADRLWQAGRQVYVMRFGQWDDPASIGRGKIGYYIRAAQLYHPDRLTEMRLEEI